MSNGGSADGCLKWKWIDFSPPDKQAIESWYWSAFLLIPVMSTFETVKAFFHGEREEGERTKEDAKEQRDLRLSDLKGSK